MIGKKIRYTYIGAHEIEQNEIAHILDVIIEDRNTAYLIKGSYGKVKSIKPSQIIKILN